jgi:cell division protein FtsW (lipid II flippase)
MSHGLLIFGVGLLFFGVVYTWMGESYERFYGWIYRSKEPKKFWWSVATYYLLGIFCIVADVFDLPRDFLLGVLFIGIFVYLVYLLIRWVIRQKR